MNVFVIMLPVLIHISICVGNWITLVFEPIMKFLFVRSRKMSFYEAESVCNINGGKLFEPRDENVMKTVYEYARKESIGEFWLGINDISFEGLFVYTSNNSRIWFNNWDEGEPNNREGGENCVQVKRNGFWNDVSCHGDGMSFVCMKGK